MAIRRRGESKRRARRDDAPGDEDRDAPGRPSDDRDDDRDGDDVDLDERLGSVISDRFRNPTSAEELRAAFRRRQDDDPPPRLRDEFNRKYPTETLFSPTLEDDFELPPSEPEDRSRTTGDYYYDPDDAWDVLGVAPGASWPEIAAAHRKLAMQHHPDRLLDSTPEDRAASEERMRDINVAYSVLRRLTGH